MIPGKLPIKPNLALVGMDHLQAEIFRRCQSCLIMTATIEDPGSPIVRMAYDGGALGALGLAIIAEEKIRRELGESEGI